MNNFFRRMSQLGLPPLTMRRMWVCYRHAWPAAINRCQSLAAIYQWCDPKQSSTYIYIDLSLICINLYQLSSNYCPLYTNHSKYIQVFFLSSILHMQCTSWLWYSYIVIILYSWPVPGVLGYYNSCILNNLPFTSLLLHVFFFRGGVFCHCNTQIHGLFYLHLINHVWCGIWISQSYVSYSLSVTSCPHIIYNYGSVPFYIGISNLHIQAYNTTILSFTEFTLIRHSTHGWKGFCST